MTGPDRPLSPQQHAELVALVLAADARNTAGLVALLDRLAALTRS